MFLRNLNVEIIEKKDMIIIWNDNGLNNCVWFKGLLLLFCWCVMVWLNGWIL